ncbi:hypothetical protein [Aquimarina sp. 2201CG5-10]|uniref:hypothetical protein n=1 Tax=Aquimarina callyspongiae TaxID=3098150 RepID=UPI002AB59537|nr:hypothetical protein [Aquimarina sp. 2201CG5-10]MDY8137582.1 hypothetical protein [Aquimarina sp. 2201CG5-10]
MDSNESNNESNKKNKESSEVQIAKISANQAKVIALIGALVSIITVVITQFGGLITSAQENKVISLVVEELSNSSVDTIEGKKIIRIYEPIPIGTIIPSVLSWKEFYKQVEGVKVTNFNAKHSKWSPADGRKVEYSKYYQDVEKIEVPDLRGVFLRGLNDFDPIYNNKPKHPNQLDPYGDNRKVGHFQEDIIKNHKHRVKGGSSSFRAISDERGKHVMSLPNYNVTEDSILIKETRPKNRAVYYYIKIN